MSLLGVCLTIRGWINLLPSIRVRSRQNQESSIFLLDQLLIGSQFSELFGRANSKSWCFLSSTRVGCFYYIINPKSSETTPNWNKSVQEVGWNGFWNLRENLSLNSAYQGYFLGDGFSSLLSWVSVTLHIYIFMFYWLEFFVRSLFVSFVNVKTNMSTWDILNMRCYQIEFYIDFDLIFSLGPREKDHIFIPFVKTFQCMALAWTTWRSVCLVLRFHAIFVMFVFFSAKQLCLLMIYMKCGRDLPKLLMKLSIKLEELTYNKTYS